ncbi:MAG: hypothetical protein M9942_07370 [Microthrixaceae bacterium]|nr:hypothetical protein [Microthrixaceae bacterium]
MTEIPEHLLQRSRQRRAALTGEGGGDDAAPSGGDAAAAPATTGSPAPAAAAPAAPAVPEPEPEPEPTPPWVEAAESRKKVPWWAAAALSILPLFFIVYAWTLGEPTNDEGPLAVGNELYNGSAGCAGCHGGGGGGGVGPAMAGGAVVETFPEPADMITWVALGSAGYQDAGFSTYGATDKPIAGGMPGQAATLTPSEIMDVVLHERTEFGGEEFDIAVWEEGFEDKINELLPDQADEYMTVLEEWSATPPTG